MSGLRRRRDALDSPHVKAWRESRRDLMESDWRDIPDRTSRRTPSPPSCTAAPVEQAAPQRRSGALQYLGVPDVDASAAEYGRRKQAMIVCLIDGGDFRRRPDALRFVIAAKDAGSCSPRRRLEERGAAPSPGHPRHLPGGAGISSAWLAPGLALLELFDAEEA